MRPTDSAWAEFAGAFAFFALAVLVALLWAFGLAVRDTVRERRIKGRAR